jgi:hypothetical protein
VDDPKDKEEDLFSPGNLRLPAKFNAPSSPGEFHPQALKDPDVTVSRHPAHIISPPSFKNKRMGRTSIISDKISSSH